MADKLTNHFLSRQGYDVITVDNPGAPEILSLAPDIDAIMMISKKILNDIYQELPRLKILARRGVGYDNIDAHYAAQQGVWVTNTPGANAHSVAEMALMNILMLARRYREVDKLTRIDDWSGAYQLLGHDLTETTVGIVGFGNVGRELSKLLSILGVRVLIYDRNPRQTKYGTFVEWDELFQEADFVSLHLAANKYTKHIVGNHEFAMMKSDASLINLSRGSIVNEAELIQALQAHVIGGAALDVFEIEPLMAKSTLLQLQNVIITPHIGANTIEANRKMAMTAAQMIDSVLSGQVPKYAVNHPILVN
ncbi:D-3-phosphoglycerate dehydrogenase [Paucilactobacillus oligofermentans DSM 15707 = LMG 22743]|uniref:D-3-phosphoglycerate dehydrogenase n=2 Tax=Paucilactobacillus oligofermentans TaxID=293371 RepID=A0A0R1RN48_9LACO|nr:D-3-phosphoglycerate dehydrogenase [Paucilactobacillus oligofermentans DSM 15707 = LMG 22743]